MGYWGKDAQDPIERLDKCVVDLQDRYKYNYHYNYHYGEKITRSPAEREAAMAGIVGALEGYPNLDELDSRCLTIFGLCGVSIKKGSPREARLAYRAVGLLLLTLRDGSPGLLLDEAFPTLSRAIQAQPSHDGAPKLVAAIDCLAVATFAGARDAEEAERVRKAIWAVAFPTVSSRSGKDPAPKMIPAVVVAAVSAWTFLLTVTVSATSGQRKADRGAWNATVASLAGLLDADDRKVRMAAGEALAVCADLNLTWHTSRKDMDAQLVAKVSDLATEAGGKGADNTMLAEQKELFRQIADFLDHGERPDMSVQMSSERHAVVRVSTWVRHVQLSFVRKFLGNGFLNHVRDNARFSEAFSFSRQEGKPLSIEKKKLSIEKKKPSSKTKHREYLEVKHDSEWEWKHIFGLDCYRRAEKMLQLGWH